MKKQFWIDTWFERDRSMVVLYHGEPKNPSNSTTIAEWWDAAVTEAVDNGFLNPRDWLGSVIEYCRSVKLDAFMRAERS